MGTILGFLLIALFALLIIGLVKPASVLKWSKKPTRLKVIGCYFLFSIIIASLINLIDTTEDDLPIDTANSERTEHKKTPKELEEEKKLEAEKIAEALAAKKDQLRKEIKSIDDGIDFSTFRGDIELIKLEVAMFATWAKMINEAEKSEDKELVSLASELKSKVGKVQNSEFISIRTDYARRVSETLWEHDVEVTAFGLNREYISFTSTVFTKNKNKKDFQIKAYDMLHLCRFKEAQYEWYDGESHPTTFTVYQGEDSDLVIQN